MLNLFRPTQLSPEDLAALTEAKRNLETPSLAVELAAQLGRPLEAGFKRLPAPFTNRLQRVSQAALLHGLEFAVGSPLGALDRGPTAVKRARLRRWLSAGSGAVGGALGPWSLLVELPFSTTIILAAIADVARQEGHDLSRLDVRLACLEVFALSGPGPRDNAAESGYWLVRASLAKTFADAAAYLVQRGLVVEGAPPLVRLVSALAARLTGTVTAQAAARSLPLVSAAGAAAVNLLFLRHFEAIARGHFVVKRLEAKYGDETVRASYTELTV